MTKEQLEKINRFTRRELTEDEIYIFSVILCDNEIDRDCERFSDDALEKLSSLFIGKTGIFDHDPRSAHQSARIFDTELVTDASRTTKNGEAYRFLKAQVYMVRTDENKSLIAEIDGGIKKEVSISCAASERICSVCGSDKAKLSCEHIKGRIYNGKLCHTVLSGISDAYEWSFVAVPAQVNAGVTKRFLTDDSTTVSTPADENRTHSERELLSSIRRLAYFRGGLSRAEEITAKAAGLDVTQLDALRRSLENEAPSKGITVQLAGGNAPDEESFSDFSMR